MAILILRRFEREPLRDPSPETALAVPAGPRVYLPSPAELRQMLPPPPSPKAAVTPPPAAQAKDRISIGPPDTRRAKEMWLRRDEEIPKTSQGNGVAGDQPAPRSPRAPAPAGADTEAGSKTAANTPPQTSGGLRLPSGRGDQPPPGPTAEPSIRGSLSRLQDRWAQGGGLGLGKSGSKTIGPLQYDPEGADFTEWIDHFRRELYRNWVAPQAALMGFRGNVQIGFAFARDGSLVEAQILKTSGTVSLDGAAKNAVVGSRQLPLPSDFGPETFALVATFHY